jgi:hypothetical protein
LETKVDQRLLREDTYGMYGKTAFTDVENYSSVIGADIQVCEGFDLLTRTDAPVPPIERAASLCGHCCHGQTLCGWRFHNLSEFGMILRLYRPHVTLRHEALLPLALRNSS